MFNSQKINNDPKPWTSDPWDRRSASKYGPEFNLGDWNRREEPRPEYDNNPNPILEMIRAKDVKPFEYKIFLGLLPEKPLTPNVSQEHVDHARRVLEKLVNVYG